MKLSKSKKRFIARQTEEKRKKSESISKWVNAHRQNTSIKRTKDGSFSNQKNTKYSEEHIAK